MLKKKSYTKNAMFDKFSMESIENSGYLFLYLNHFMAKKFIVLFYLPNKTLKDFGIFLTFFLCYFSIIKKFNPKKN